MVKARDALLAFAARAALNRYVRGGSNRAAGGGAYYRPRTAARVAPRAAVRAKSKTALMAMRRRRPNPYARRAPKPGLGGRASFSKWNVWRKANRQVSTMKKVGAPNYYNSNHGFRVVAGSGFQNATDNGLATLADLKQLMLKVPNQVGANQVTRFVLESCSNEFLMTNNSLATAYVDIYDIIRKRDSTQAVSSQDPREAWVTGMTQEVPGGGTGAEFLNLNCLPGDSRLFRDYFKVVKRTHIGLTQGSTHRHLVSYKPNKIIGSELLNEAEGDLANHTIYTMIVVYGQPDSVAQEGAPALVSTAEVAIDVVCASRYKFTWVQDVATNYYFTDNLTTLVGDIVNIGSGAIQPAAIVNP